MGRKIQILFALLVFVLAGAGLWVGLGWRELSQPEPAYQGKPLSYWLQGYEIYSATNRPTRMEAEVAVREMGTNALPRLLQMLATPDSSLKDVFFAWVEKQRFIKIKPHMKSRMKPFIAFWGISPMKQKATCAVPELIKIYDRNPNEVAREIIAVILSGIGPPAKAAIPQLLRGVLDTNGNVRFNSVYALGEIRGDPHSVVPALVRCLHDPAPEVRGNAARALGAFGYEAKEAVPALRELLKEEQAKPPNPAANQNFSWRVGILPSGRPLWSTNFDVIGVVTNALEAIAPEPVESDVGIQKWQPLEKNKQSGGFSD